MTSAVKRALCEEIEIDLLEANQHFHILSDNIVDEAMQEIQDVTCVKAIMSAATENKSIPVLRNSFRKMMERARSSPRRLAALMDVGLFVAIKAALDSSRKTLTTTNNDARAKLCIYTLMSLSEVASTGSICQGHATPTIAWKQYARAAGVDDSLSELLAMSSISDTARIGIGECIWTLLREESVDSALRLHRRNCTKGVIAAVVANKIPDNGVFLDLLSTLLKTCSACRFVLRDNRRAKAVIQKLITALDNHPNAAMDCMCSLCDNDLPRTSQHIPKEDRDDLVRKLMASLSVSSMRVMQSLLARGINSFDGQIKNNKVVWGEKAERVADEWGLVIKLGLESLYTHVYSSFCRDTHSTFYTILDSIGQGVLMSPVEVLRALELLRNTMKVLTFHRAIVELESCLQAVLQLSLASRVPLTGFADIFKGMAMLFGSQFDEMCRGKRFAHCPAEKTEYDAADLCPICLNRLDTPSIEGDSVHITTCKHFMHASCVRKCLDTGTGSCAVCRCEGVDVIEQVMGPRQTYNPFTRRYIM